MTKNNSKKASDSGDQPARRRASARALFPKKRNAAPIEESPVRDERPEIGPDASTAGRRVSARATETVQSEHPARAKTEPSAEDTAGATVSERPPALADMERDLAGLLSDVDGADGDGDARRRAADAIGRIAARLYPDGNTHRDETLLGGARDLLSTDYYVRQWGRLGMRGRSEHIDDFGLDRTYEARVQGTLDVLYERYFRVAVHGIENLPAQGAALLVCNHSGTLPWDGVLLKTAIRHAHPQARSLRWLTDDFVFHSPFIGAWLNRIGAVRACPENAERLLERGELLAAFPEGVKGIGKTYGERHQLQRFGRGGHIKLALRLQVPLIPVAIVGGEETFPLLYKVRAFSKLMGLPFIPITPLFPWFGPLGLLPLPSRWQIVIGEPMRELSEVSQRAATDSVLVNDLNQRLRGRVHDLLQTALSNRGANPFL